MSALQSLKNRSKRYVICSDMSKDYKKDFFGVLVYDFEPSPKVS